MNNLMYNKIIKQHKIIIIIIQEQKCNHDPNEKKKEKEKTNILSGSPTYFTNYLMH